MDGVELFNLVAKITVDSKDFEQGLKDSESQANSFESTFSAVTEKLKTALTAAGIAAAVKAIGDAFKQAIDMAAQYGDAVDKGSQRLGISADAYQEWAHALEQSGSDVSSLGAGIKNINSFLSGNADEGLASAFEDLGVSALDAEGNVKSTEEALKEVILTLAEMDQDAYRGTLVTSIFGKNGADLNAFLNSGKEGIKELTDEAHELGLVMTDEEIANSVAYGDAIANMNAAVDALKTSIVTGLLPALTDAANFVAEIISFFNWRTHADNSAEAQFENIDKAASNAVATIDVTQSTAEGLIDKLAAMGDETERTAEQTAVWKGLASELISLVPSLAGQIDLETGSISASTEELKANTAEWARNARQQALNNALAEKREVLAQKAQESVEKQVEAQVAQSRAAALTGQALETANGLLADMGKEANLKTYEDLLGFLDETAKSGFYKMNKGQKKAYQEEFLPQVAAIAEANAEAEKASEQAQKLDEELTKAQEEYQLYAEAITGMMEDAETSTGEAQSAVDSLNTAIDSLPSEKTITIKVASLDDGQDYFHNAKGMDYVPYDNYVSRLHRGEMVLNKSRADDYREGRTGSLESMTAAIAAAVRAGMQNVNYNFALDGEKVAHNTTDRQNNDQMAWRFAVT